MSALAVVLAAAVLALWPRASTAESPQPVVPTTAGVADRGTTTTRSSPTTTTTSTPGTSQTQFDETVEAESILRSFWFGWFDGIYHQDERRIRDVVINESDVDDARAAFGEMEFVGAPDPSALILENVEVLHRDSDCVAIWAVVSAPAFREGSTDGVFVMRLTEAGWKKLSHWIYRGDLWEADCDALLP